MKNRIGGWGLILGVALLLMTGCATADPPKPQVLFELEGHDNGLPITLGNVKSLKVYAPQGQQVQQEHWAARALGQALSVVGTVAGIYYGGQAITNLADVVGKNAGHNITNTITGSFNPHTTNTTASYGASP